MNAPIQISENCWIHTNEFGVFYTKTSDPYSELHREDGPAIEYKNGEKHWFLNGEHHRENSPAVEMVDGHQEWFIDGKHHRIGGPAIEYPNGETSWYYKGTEIPFKKNLKLLNKK